METTKKKIKRKTIFTNERYINEQMLKFIVYNIEKYEMNCKVNKTEIDVKDLQEILKKHQEECFVKIQNNLEIKKIYKDDKTKLVNDYTRMMDKVLENLIEDE
jgi:hypothetical protein